MSSLRTLLPWDLPEVVYFSKGWAGTKHTLGSPPEEDQDEFGPLEYLLVSKVDETDMPRLLNLNVTYGTYWYREPKRKPWQISTSRFDFIQPVVNLKDLLGFIDPQSIYEQWGASTARTILTGHYLATRHKDLFDAWHRAGSSKNELKKATNKYWNSLSLDFGGITRLTIYINEELRSWGDSFSSSLLAQLMDVGPRTIHTRLYEARKFGNLHDVGSEIRLKE